MSLLLETIRLSDGVYENLFHHDQRMNRALRQLCNVEDHFELEEFLTHIERPVKGLYKCRITYDETQKEVEFIPYTPGAVRSLKLVEDNDISYEHKFKDRSEIDALFEQRGDCDDILIIKKDMVTDASYANIAFRRKKHWYTPWSALLHGTMRAYLLERGMIIEESISVDDIGSFDGFKLINAMLRWDAPEQSIRQLIN
jgi:4-amino-4-deoxychorismate lyase